MKKPFFEFCSTISIQLFLFAISFPIYSLTLQEALVTTFEKNPKTQANTMVLKAMEEQTKAAWGRIYPRLDLSMSVMNNRTATNFQNVTSISKSSSVNASVQGTMNIYNGRANYYDAKAAEYSQRAMEANYNSTNGFIPNTKGSLSDLVLNSYLLIDMQNVVLEMMKMKVRIYQKAMNLESDSIKRTIYSNIIQQLQTGIKDNEFSLIQARQDFEYIVRIPPPDDLDSFDQIIENLKIPEAIETALQVANEKNPELIYKSYSIEAAKYNERSIRARLYSPRVDLFYSWSPVGSSFVDNSSPVRSSGHTVGITVSMNFDIGGIHLARSSRYSKEAAELEKESAIQDLEHNIKSLYPTLANSFDQVKQYEHNLQDIQDALTEIEKNLDQGKSVSKDDVTANLDMYEMNWWNLVSRKKNIVSLKFRIQKTLGILF